MRRIDFCELDSIPRMAWCARVDRDERNVTVHHGKWVETGDNEFVEGAWNGSFSEWAFPTADIFLGSGGVRLESEMLFSTASHPFEPLYSLTRDDELFVSNSLSFLSAASGIRPVYDYPHYMADLTSFKRGLSRCVARIPMHLGEEVRIHYCTNVRVSTDLALREEPRSVLPPVGCFAEYREFLSSIVSEISRNAGDDERTRRYAPLATISSGYDSPATAVLAREVGATMAVTFRSARSVFGQTPDTGVDIARHMGLEAVEADRLAYRKREDLPEVDFLATGTGGEDVVLTAFEDLFVGSTLFTGFLGDTVWGKYHPDPHRSLDFAMSHVAGASLREFRLRIGFIHFPVPLTTFTQHPSLQRISRSEEMEPWSVEDRHSISRDALLGRVGPGYDRPIARRIVEEEGVPRELFGQAKRAITQPFYHGEALDGIMSPRSLGKFRNFLEEFDLPPDGVWPLARTIAAKTHSLLSIPFDAIRKVSTYMGRPSGVSLPWPDRLTWPPGENLYLFHWAVGEVQGRYERALQMNDPDGD